MSLLPAEITRLRELEESLWRAETRFDRDYLERVLHLDFLEFGRSGRTYDREKSLTMAARPIDAEVRDLAVHRIADDAVLTTYVSAVRRNDTVELANRSSLWVRTGDDWRLRFHQGTPVPAPAD